MTEITEEYDQITDTTQHEQPGWENGQAKATTPYSTSQTKVHAQQNQSPFSTKFIADFEPAKSKSKEGSKKAASKKPAARTQKNEDAAKSRNQRIAQPAAFA